MENGIIVKIYIVKTYTTFCVSVWSWVIVTQGNLIQTHGHGGPSSPREAYPVQNQMFLIYVVWMRWDGGGITWTVMEKQGGNEVKEKE